MVLHETGSFPAIQRDQIVTKDQFHWDPSEWMRRWRPATSKESLCNAHPTVVW